MADDLTTDGSITDLMSDRRVCPTCGAEGMIRGVEGFPIPGHAATSKRVYTVICPNGHHWTVEMPAMSS